MKLVLIFYVHQILFFFFLTKILVDGFAEIGL